MTEEAAIAAKAEALFAAPVSELGYRLLEVQYRREDRLVLRLIIEGEQGINLDDCGKVSELAGRLLDVEDFISQAFALEVSSPGIFRPLKDPRHFAQSIGKVAKLTLAAQTLPERKNRKLRGTIEEASETHIQFRVKDGLLNLPIEGISKARLDPDI